MKSKYMSTSITLKEKKSDKKEELDEKMLTSPRIISPRPTSSSFKQDKLASPVLSVRREKRAISPYQKEETKEFKKPEEITKELKRVAYSQSKLKQPVILKRQQTLDPSKTEEEKKEEL